MIFLVFCDDQDSSSGVSITGIFDDLREARDFAHSEGPEYKVLKTGFGPIEWNKMAPTPDWTPFQ